MKYVVGCERVCVSLGDINTAFNLKSVLAFCNLTFKLGVCMYFVCVGMPRERSVTRGASAAKEGSFTLTVKSLVFTVNWSLEAT